MIRWIVLLLTSNTYVVCANAVAELRSRSDDVRKIGSDGDVDRQRIGSSGRTSSRNYIVTSMSQSEEETRSPTVRWFYAELDASRSSEEPMGKEVSRCAMNGDEKATNIVVSLRNDQVSHRSVRFYLLS
ncbi:unnamed protein product [Nippostrongylus brasiliensis]|uniref:Secreted RxLR effector peptide protein n=1 Tax=Nippostrongylus brasiliensis TaxID=27835 RepID=A0A0N4YV56_NIPBR|nr:unnamed protein product [Nippostrongylus brasiliensis]